LWLLIPFAENKLKTEVLLAAIGKREQREFVKCRFGTLFCVFAVMRSWASC